MNSLKTTILKNKVLISVISVALLLLLIIPTTLVLAADDGSADKVGGDFIDKILWSLVNGVFGFMVYIGGKVLNAGITDFVVGFGDLYITTGLGFAIEELWKIIRDVFNLAFIFGLVYIGFKMILDSSDSNARKMLVNIILAALLVNFSLFFTKFIIDFSNIAAIQVAQAFTNNPTVGYKVSDSFMEVYGLQRIWGDSGQGGSLISDISSGRGNGMTYIFGTMILFIVTAFVFFTGGLLLIIRFVMLNLFMILSPVMFLGWVFPGLAHYSRTYWNQFLGRAFFAPAYIFLLYISYKIFIEFGNLTKNANLQGVFTAGGKAPEHSDVATAIPYFIIMCTFLIASIIIGQKMGADGASMAISMGRNVSKRAGRSLMRGAGNLTFGLTAKTMQKTVGAGANKLADNATLRKWSSQSALVRGARKGIRSTADATFDARNIVPGLSEKIGVGPGMRSGYVTAQKEAEKREIAYAKTLEKDTRDSLGNLLPEVEKTITARADAYGKALQDTKVSKEKEKETKINEINEQENRADIEAEIKSLKGQLDLTQDDTLKETLNKEITEKQTRLNNIDSRIKDETKAYDDEITSLDKDIREFETSAGRNKKLREEEARVKYEDVISHKQQREAEAGNIRQATKTIAAGAVGAGAVFAATAASPIAAAVAGAVIAANTWNRGLNKARANAIAKEYGADGTKKAVKEQQKDKMRMLAEAQKEILNTENAPAQDTTNQPSNNA